MLNALAALAAPFLIAATPPAPTPTPTAIAPAMPALGGLRFSATGEAATLELTLPRMVQLSERATTEAWRLRLPGVRADLAELALQDGVLPSLKATVDAEGTTLEIPWAYWCPTDYEIAADAARVRVTFRKIYQEVEREVLAPGVVHEHRRQADAHGPLNVNVLRVDPHTPGVRILPGMAKGGAYFAREPVSAITRRYGALAGINGSYFSMRTGEPLGLLMIDGELVSAPLYNRTALAIGSDGEITIGNTQLSTRLVLPGGQSYDFDGVNQKRGLNRMVLYTARYGVSTFTPAGGQEYSLLPDGTILEAHENDTPIPPGGYVISAHGQAAAWLARYAKVGTKVKLESPLKAYWPGVRHAVGGGPALLHGGEVAITAFEEKFQPDIAKSITSRTAVGVTPSGEVLMVTVDGKQPHLSRGLSLAGLAYLLKDLGATEAMNLDGGGSTAMAIGPAVVNHPSDGSERWVNNALLVFASTSTASR